MTQRISHSASGTHREQARRLLSERNRVRHAVQLRRGAAAVAADVGGPRAAGCGLRGVVRGCRPRCCCQQQRPSRAGYAGVRERADDGGLSERPDHRGLPERPDHRGLSERPDHAGLPERPDHAGLSERANDAGPPRGIAGTELLGFPELRSGARVRVRSGARRRRRRRPVGPRSSCRDVEHGSRWGGAGHPLCRVRASGIPAPWDSDRQDADPNARRRRRCVQNDARPRRPGDPRHRAARVAHLPRRGRHHRVEAADRAERRRPPQARASRSSAERWQRQRCWCGWRQCGPWWRWRR